MINRSRENLPIKNVKWNFKSLDSKDNIISLNMNYELGPLKKTKFGVLYHKFSDPDLPFFRYETNNEYEEVEKSKDFIIMNMLEDQILTMFLEQGEDYSRVMLMVFGVTPSTDVTQSLEFLENQTSFNQIPLETISNLSLLE